MNSYSMLELFGIPVYKTHLSLEDAVVDQLVDQDFYRMDAGNGFCSIDNKVLEYHPQIKEKILAAVNHFLFQILNVKDNLTFEIKNSWVTKHVPGDWSQKHDHVNSIISGIVYLKVDSLSGNLILHKDSMWQNIFPRCLNIQFKQPSTLTSSAWSITPQNNEIYLFPSSLAHSVEKNMSNEDRYVLAFNVFPKGKLGTSKLNELGI